MNFWKLPRKPEPEEMDEAEEVESYSAAAAARHLDAIDDTFVDHLLRLFPSPGSAGFQGTPTEAVPPRGIGDPVQPAAADETAGWKGTPTHQNALGSPWKPALPGAHPAFRPRPCRPGWGLDMGTGPAEIPIKVLRKIPDIRMVGIDRSRNMLARARQNALRAGVSDRLALVVADGHSLPFPDGVFSMLLCNSVLHHARQPIQLLREMVRVAASQSPLLLRDLRRPSWLFLRWHLWRHGRHYQGLMRKLFEDSVQAAYTLEELEEFLREAKLGGLGTFRFRGAHIGIERRARG